MKFVPMLGWWVCLLAAPAPVLATDTPSPVASLENKFHAAKTKLWTEHQAATGKLNHGYKNALARQGSTAQQSGNLDTYLAAKNESDRFTLNPQVGPNDFSKDPQVAKTQRSYADQRKTLDEGFSLRFANMISQYEAALIKLQTRLTKEQHIEEAIKARNAQQNLALDADVIAARAHAEAVQDRAREEARLAATAPKTEPPAFPPTTQNVFKGKDKSRIKDRFEELMDLLIDENHDEAIQYIDPLYIEEKGLIGGKIVLKILSGFLTVMDQANASLKVKGIDLPPPGDDATVTPVIVHPHGTKKGDDQRWVKRNGDWYLFIDR